MRTFKKICFAAMLAVSLLALAGTAWAEGPLNVVPEGVSWESFPAPF